MSHGDRVTALAPGFSVIGASPNAPFAITTDPGRHFYAVQFHPEVAPHRQRRAASSATSPTSPASPATGRCPPTRTRRSRRSGRRSAMRKVICGLSGGVDCSVAAVLIHEAIGDQLTCVFVDTGLMRQGEAEEVVTLFRDHYNIPLIHADESDRFLDALAGVTDPEVKRKTIGRLFIEVFEARAAEVGDARFLAQGTLYPDVIESVSFTGGPSVTIKSHHNVGGLPERMSLAARRAAARALQGRGPRPRPRARPARGLRRPPPLSRPRPRHPLPRRDHPREARDPAQGRRGLPRPDPPPRPLRRDLAGLRGAASGPHRRRDGRRPHLRLRLRAPRGDQRRRDDGRLLPLLPRLPRRDRDADRGRGEGHQPGDLRHHLEAPRARSSGSDGGRGRSGCAHGSASIRALASDLRSGEPLRPGPTRQGPNLARTAGAAARLSPGRRSPTA